MRASSARPSPHYLRWAHPIASTAQLPEHAPRLAAVDPAPRPPSPALPSEEIKPTSVAHDHDGDLAAPSSPSDRQ